MDAHVVLNSILLLASSIWAVTKRVWSKSVPLCDAWKAANGLWVPISNAIGLWVLVVMGVYLQRERHAVVTGVAGALDHSSRLHFLPCNVPWSAEILKTYNNVNADIL